MEEFRALSRSRAFVDITIFISFFLLLFLFISPLLRFSFSILARLQANCAFEDIVLFLAIRALKLLGLHFLPLLMTGSEFVQISSTKLGVKAVIVGLETFFMEGLTTDSFAENCASWSLAFAAKLLELLVSLLFFKLFLLFFR